MNQTPKLVSRWIQSPVVFIQDIWGLKPQQVKKEYESEVAIYLKNGQWNKVKVSHFDNFIKGKHITLQQWLILTAVEYGLIYRKPKVSVVSGHGVGKDTTLSWLILWYLFCHKDAQIGATAPTSEGIHDVLWKEMMLWLDKMPTEIKNLYEWQTGYIRIKQRPETWFARARTARKETPEAIAGLHGDNVFIAVDEASGVDDAIYQAGEGSLTGPNTLVLLIGNGLRADGYFYQTHHTDKEYWQTLQLDAEESPIVTKASIEERERCRFQGTSSSGDQRDRRTFGKSQRHGTTVAGRKLYAWLDS